MAAKSLRLIGSAQKFGQTWTKLGHLLTNQIIGFCKEFTWPQKPHGSIALIKKFGQIWTSLHKLGQVWTKFGHLPTNQDYCINLKEKASNKEEVKVADIFNEVCIKFVKRFKICKSLVQYLQIVVTLKYNDYRSR